MLFFAGVLSVLSPCKKRESRMISHFCHSKQQLHHAGNVVLESATGPWSSCFAETWPGGQEEYWLRVLRHVNHTIICTGMARAIHQANSACQFTCRLCGVQALILARTGTPSQSS